MSSWKFARSVLYSWSGLFISYSPLYPLYICLRHITTLQYSGRGRGREGCIRNESSPISTSYSQTVHLISLRPQSKCGEVKWCDAVWGSPATVCALPGRRPRGGGCLHWGNAHLAAAIFTLSSCIQPAKIVLAGAFWLTRRFYYFPLDLFFLRGHYKSTFRAKKVRI